jgi:SpoVK/Ycf46/Vps4 family AAA+-type ATPase
MKQTEASIVYEPYEHPADHLRDELTKLDFIIEAALAQMTVPPQQDAALEPFRGWVITEADARQSLRESARVVPLTPEQQQWLHAWDDMISVRVQHARQLGVRLPLAELRQAFALSDWDVSCLIAVLAPEMDRRYEKLYAYLQDDMTCKFASIDLILRLCCRDGAEQQQALSRLIGNSILTRVLFRKNLPSDGFMRSIMSAPIRIAERICCFIQQIDPKLEGALTKLRLFQPDHEALPPLRIDHALQHNLERHWQHDTAKLYFMHGPSGSGKTFHARHICRHLNLSLLEWDMSDAPTDAAGFLEQVEQILTEATLRQAIPAFDRFHRLLDAESAPRRAEWLLERLATWHKSAFIFSERPWASLNPQSANLIPLQLTLPDAAARKQLWLDAVSPYAPLTDLEAGALAAKFRFTAGLIATTVEAAQRINQWESSDESNPTLPANIGKWLHRAAYQQVKHRLHEQAVKLDTPFEWDDLILPEEPKRLLRQACNRLQYRHKVFGEWGFERKFPYGKGISMMFTGPPGTGKTMSAMIMARELDAECYRIDLSRIVSKYVGETEKHLHELFAEAQLSGAILFFDEADALFGKRSEVKDANDKYANMETSYLLQKMEEYDGLTILATNLAQNLDEAFIRRIHFIVKFPFPDLAQREQLWRTMFPPQMPLDADIDYRYLAQTFELAGGPIKNVVLTAAYLAAEEGASTGMRHIMEAVKQEYKKIGKLLMKDRLGIYADK